MRVMSQQQARLREAERLAAGQQFDQALLVYREVFAHIVSATTPFMMLRYGDVLAQPGPSIDAMAAFCGITIDEASRGKAIAFVSRP